MLSVILRRLKVLLNVTLFGSVLNGNIILLSVILTNDMVYRTSFSFLHVEASVKDLERDVERLTVLEEDVLIAAVETAVIDCLFTVKRKTVNGLIGAVF